MVVLDVIAIVLGVLVFGYFICDFILCMTNHDLWLHWIWIRDRKWHGDDENPYD